MIDPAQFVGRGDAERRHEVMHVEPVGAARAGALLLGEPDVFLGDVGEARQHRGEVAPLWVGADGRGRDGGQGLDHAGLTMAQILYVINRIIT